MEEEDKKTQKTNNLVGFRMTCLSGLRSDAAQLFAKDAEPPGIREFRSRLVGFKRIAKKWLGYQDSNLDSWYQKPESCRWTIPQYNTVRDTARHEYVKKMVGREGIEPATLGLKVPCSTN